MHSCVRHVGVCVKRACRLHPRYCRIPARRGPAADPPENPLTLVRALKAVRGADWGVRGEPPPVCPAAALPCGVVVPALADVCACNVGRPDVVRHLHEGRPPNAQRAASFSTRTPCCRKIARQQTTHARSPRLTRS
jgi:hypothetical protein